MHDALTHVSLLSSVEIQPQLYPIMNHGACLHTAARQQK